MMNSIPMDADFEVISSRRSERFLSKVREFTSLHHVYSISYSTTPAKELFDGIMVNVTKYSAFIIYRGN